MTLGRISGCNSASEQGTLPATERPRSAFELCMPCSCPRSAAEDKGAGVLTFLSQPWAVTAQSPALSMQQAGYPLVGCFSPLFSFDK